MKIEMEDDLGFATLRVVINIPDEMGELAGDQKYRLYTQLDSLLKIFESAIHTMPINEVEREHIEKEVTTP